VNGVAPTAGAQKEAQMSGFRSRSLLDLLILLLISLLLFAVLAANAAAITPTVSTGKADKLAAHSAELHGTVNPNGSATEYFFEYGRTTEYGNFKPLPAVEVGSGLASVEVAVV